MKLAENMKALSAICVSDTDFDNRNSQTFFAAKELRYYFNRMSCASFEIKRAGECENAVTLSLAEGDDAFYVQRPLSFLAISLVIDAEGNLVAFSQRIQPVPGVSAMEI